MFQVKVADLHYICIVDVLFYVRRVIRGNIVEVRSGLQLSQLCLTGKIFAFGRSGFKSSTRDRLWLAGVFVIYFPGKCQDSKPT